MSRPRADRFLSVAKVAAIVDLSPASIYRRVQAGTFPRFARVGGISVRWSEHEVRVWMAERLSARTAPSEEARHG